MRRIPSGRCLLVGVGVGTSPVRTLGPREDPRSLESRGGPPLGAHDHLAAPRHDSRSGRDQLHLCAGGVREGGAGSGSRQRVVSVDSSWTTRSGRSATSVCPITTGSARRNSRRPVRPHSPRCVHHPTTQRGPRQRPRRNALSHDRRALRCGRGNANTGRAIPRFTSGRYCRGSGR